MEVTDMAIETYCTQMWPDPCASICSCVHGARRY
jgi:hypothetical protein